MEENIIDRARRYMELAHMLTKADEDARQDEVSPEYLHEALIRLYHAKKLEADIEECQAQLSQDSDGETVEAVEDAAQAVQEASEVSFDLVERYSADNEEFAAKIESLKLESAEDGLDDLLNKLYKCEGIIRLAYRCATRYPTYGITESIMGGAPDTEPIDDPEEYIADDMDVDIMALLAARDDLVAKIGPLVEKLN